MTWETLRDIKRENARLEAEASSLPPVACPIDGTPLQERAGIRNCPLGNYRWEG